ncbi:hypothetical protein [Jeotgalibacillus aurantiacus]|uniref:hypothetical protein n=1 Tax=Jeotgalibacillus aurantiacus TaxID=2763266 RepID=UPI001D0AECFA|nr:hypothetical protein [Jeotgalibacillus aurantiacus]
MEIYDFQYMILFTLLMGMVAVCVRLIVTKEKQAVSTFTLILTSFVTFFITVFNLIIAGYVSDEIASGGDPYLMILSFFVMLFIPVNFALFIGLKKRGRSTARIDI